MQDIETLLIRPTSPVSIGSVSDFDSFQLWHRSNYGNSYKTPSFQEVLKEIGYFYDPKMDCFCYFLGWNAVFPQYEGERIDFTWNQVAARYESMYQSFSEYGCD